ncbi:MAG: CHAT domain-containing protein [Saprospiraceae bacterium]
MEIIKIFGTKLTEQDNNNHQFANTFIDKIKNEIASYKIEPPHRSGSNISTGVLDNNGIVYYEFEDNTYVFLTPEEIKTLCHRERSNPKFRSIHVAEDELFLSVSLSDNNTRDGWVKKAITKFVSFLTQSQMDDFIGGITQNMVYNKAKELESNTVPTEGLVHIGNDKGFSNPVFTENNAPYFLLIHGTNSNTLGAFFNPAPNTSELENNSIIFSELKKQYDNKILAFEHHTLTKSPLENVELLSKELPTSIELTIMTHSRGGLVLDTLLMCLDAKQNPDKADRIKECLQFENCSHDVKIFENILNNLEGKTISVNQIIKVASPGGGTTLLSDKIIDYLRVITSFARNFAPLAGDVVIELAEKLIFSILRSKDNKNILPGLEVMNPESPFLDLINTYPLKKEPKSYIVTGQTRLNYSIGAISHNLLFLASRIFTAEANDLVVNTASMTQGIPLKNALVTLSNDGHVFHSSYFYQYNTAYQIKLAIESKGEFNPQTLFRSLDSSQRGIEVEFGHYSHKNISGNKPITVIIPGMMGSTLSKNNNQIWIGYWNIFTRSLLKMGVTDPDIFSDGVIATAYKSFCEFLLKEGYDVYVIHYDWRKSYMSQLPLLEKELNFIIEKSNGQPIRVVSHSKGGLLMKQLIISNFDLYQKLALSTDFKWIMCGTPWFGSYAAVKTLIGQSNTLKNLKRISFLVSYRQLLEIFSKYEGVLEMLPMNLTNSEIINKNRKGLPLYDYSDNSVWKFLYNIDKTNNYRWVTPEMNKSNFKNLINSTANIIFGYKNENLGSKTYLNSDQIYYLAGEYEETPYNLVVNEETSSLECENIPFSGDGTVTYVEGIPQGMNPEHVYYISAKHERLLDDRSSFRSILQLLENGTCNLKNTPAEKDTRSLNQYFIEPVYSNKFQKSNQVHENLRQLFGTNTGDNFTVSEGFIPLQVELSHGDLKFCEGPLMVGHFENEAITKAEAHLDTLLENYLSNKLASDHYPNNIGESLYIFKSKLHKPKGGLIIGLGNNFKLSGFGLTESIKKGVISAVLAHHESPHRYTSPLTTLSTLLIGTVFGDLNIPTSMNAIISGVEEANIFIDKLNINEMGKYTKISKLEFIEIFQDKVLSIFYELNRLKNQGKISFDPNQINTKPGNKNYLSINYDNNKWNQLRIRLNGGCPVFGNDDISTITCYQSCANCESESKSLPTGKQIAHCTHAQKYLEFDFGYGIARDENRRNYIPLDSILGYMEQIKNETNDNKNWDTEVSKTLFEMLVPNDFKQDIRSQRNLVLNLDTEIASLPWELIQDTAISQKPICVNAGMIRQLNTKNFRIKPKYSKKNNVLIIGDPIIEGAKFPQLQGAKEEAFAVSSILPNNLNVIEKINATSGEILQAIYANESKMIHIAAHGDFNPLDSRKSGVVIGFNKVIQTPIFLTAANITQMDVVPEFVFINTCYSGKNTGEANAISYSTYGFAANIGQEFIAAGVKAIIVAGWPVYDDLALLFATEFYRNFFEGTPFGESVLIARSACYNLDPERNTWGAYQCYGDYLYQYKIERKDNEKSYLLDKEVLNDLSNLNNQLDYYKGSYSTIKDQLNVINDAILALNIKDGKIQEKLAEAYYKIGDLEKAFETYQALMNLNKADFSVKSIEQLLNIEAKRIVSITIPKIKDKNIYDQSLTSLDTIIDNLKLLGNIGNGRSGERLSIIGSTYKRKAFLQIKANEDHTASLTQAIDAYKEASNNIKEDHYAESNLLLLEFFINPNNQKIKNSSKKIKKLDEFNGEYFKDIINFNKDLLEFLLHGKIDKISKDELIYLSLRDTYDYIWEHGGSRNNLSGEKEQLEMTITFLPKSVKDYSVKITVLTNLLDYLSQL